MSIPRNRVFWAVGVGHLINDMFVSMGPVLLAFLSASILHMSNTQIGFAVSLNQLVMSAGQPLFGWLADRTGGRWLGAGGVTLTVVMLVLTALAAQTGQYWLLLIPYMGLALGSGAFHPVGALHAATSDARNMATHLSMFFLLGQMGLAVGPALVGFLLERANSLAPAIESSLTPALRGPMPLKSDTSVLLPLALATTPGLVWMAFALPGPRAHRQGHARSAPSARASRSFSMPVRPTLILAAIITLRSLGQPGAISFFPVLFRNKGWDPSEYGLITSSFWLASGVAGLVFGNLADRYDPRYVVAASLIAGAPAFFLLPMTGGALVFVLAIIAGALSGASFSVTVVMAQALIPTSKGLASGLVMGFTFGVGALASLLVGGLADHVGLNLSFPVVAVVTVLAGLLGFALPRKPARATPPLGDAVAIEAVAPES